MLSNQTARKTSSTCCCHCSQIPTKRSGEPIIVVVTTPRPPPWRRRSPSWRTPTSPAAETPAPLWKREPRRHCQCSKEYSQKEQQSHLALSMRSPHVICVDTTS